VPAMRTVDQIICEQALFADEQRSLAFCPMPPFETAGASDCRMGGSCGLDFNRRILARPRCRSPLQVPQRADAGS
jgi:hypothetical protein